MDGVWLFVCNCVAMDGVRLFVCNCVAMDGVRLFVCVCLYQILTTLAFVVTVTVPLTNHEYPEGCGGTALLFLDLGARWGGWSPPSLGRFSPGKDPVPIAQ
jgi:hypothetical protein